MRAVLVTGGAGYIGSHVAYALLDQGYLPVVLDDLSTGDRAVVPAAAEFVEGKVEDEALVTGLLRKHGITGVLHFAGSIVVPDSVMRPIEYYRNNVANSIVLLDACRQAGVTSFVFSSTAAVYGLPPNLPVDEMAPTVPLTPYGHSKLMVEQVLRDFSRASSLRHAILRYFNVAGADPAGRSGQIAPTTTHLIRVVCQTALGLRPSMEILGADYSTPDGSCIRDFIHVSDLAAAHVAAVRHLDGGGESVTLNCGYGRGFSVRQVIAAAERVIGGKLPVTVGMRRPGDVAAVVADVVAIGRVLAWRPSHDDLDHIIRTSLEWERRRANAQSERTI